VATQTKLEPVTTEPQGSAPGEKGLKSGAISFVSNVVIGTASVAPAYSLAATLGFIVAVPGVGLSAPAVLLVSFIPMFCIAFAYSYMNRADPDCGTSFAWVTRAMGPQLGWVTGWVIVAADIIVMASLAQIAGIYSFLLVGWQSAAATSWAVTLVGCAWIVLMTWICLVGIELNATTQKWLLSAEVSILGLFAVVALTKTGAATPTVDWINPFHISSFGALADGVLLGLFIYWVGTAGWLSTRNRPTEPPGRAGPRSSARSCSCSSTSSSASPLRPTAARSSSSATRTTCSARLATASSARRSTSC
jgi:amino acid transporter